MNSEWMKCSFCGSDEVSWFHTIDPRSVAPWEDQPSKVWSACSECHALLMAERAGGLIARIAERRPDLEGFEALSRQVAAKAIVDEFLTLDAGIYDRRMR